LRWPFGSASTRSLLVKISLRPLTEARRLPVRLEPGDPNVTEPRSPTFIAAVSPGRTAALAWIPIAR